MLKEIPLLRAPEKSRTGMEIKPNVKYPEPNGGRHKFSPNPKKAPEPAQRREFT